MQRHRRTRAVRPGPTRAVTAAFAAGILALGLALATTASAPRPAGAQDTAITVASTTSTQNSGLFDAILPEFTGATGIGVNVVAVGTGQALRLGERGDADVVFVHARAAEEQFVAEGYGVRRHEVMYNDFIIVGPGEDPAGVGGMSDAPAALQRIAAARAPFTSRGDDSGTHKAELRLWDAAGLDPTQASGDWYRELGQGMGATLNTAAGMGAYTLADRGTWISFDNRRGLEVLVEGGPRLFNQYGIILVNPERHPHVKAEAGQRFIDWVTGDAGQQAIADYRLRGQQLFHPDAE